MTIAVAANAFAQQFTNVSTTHTTTGITTQATGSTFVVGVVGGSSAATVNVPTDSKSNTYTRIQSQVNSTVSGARCSWFYIENGVGGASHTITATTSGSDVSTVFFAEITGGALSGIKDQDVAGVEDITSPYTSNTTSTTSQAAEMALALVATDSVAGTETITWGNSFVQLAAAGDANFVTGGIAKLALASTQTVTSSVTLSGASSTGAVSFVATFKEASASTVKRDNLLLLGMGR